MRDTVGFDDIEYSVLGTIDTDEGGASIRVRMLYRSEGGSLPVLEVDLPGAKEAHYYEMTNDGLRKIEMPQR